MNELGYLAIYLYRLQVHLLTSWTECARRVKSLFFEYIQAICQFLSNAWVRSYHASRSSQPNVNTIQC